MLMSREGRKTDTSDYTVAANTSRRGFVGWSDTPLHSPLSVFWGTQYDCVIEFDIVNESRPRTCAQDCHLWSDKESLLVHC